MSLETNSKKSEAFTGGVEKKVAKCNLLLGFNNFLVRLEFANWIIDT